MYRAGAGGQVGGRMGTLLEKNILAGFPTLKPLLSSQTYLSPQEFDGTLIELATEETKAHTRSTCVPRRALMPLFGSSE
jgi:hypothetical protein